LAEPRLSVVSACVLALIAGVGAGPGPAPVQPADVAQSSAAADSKPASGQDQVNPLGPALDDPREVLKMLDQRRKVLARKEEELRDEEVRITRLRAETGQLLDRYEQTLKSKKAPQAEMAEGRKTALLQAVKMFESMPAEEAAARLEKMPEKTAVELLRQLKSKTAGAILAQVRADKAARLTEKFLAAPSRIAPK
jgi:flagellar motility protein MotE (MotC chaperone)